MKRGRRLSAKGYSLVEAMLVLIIIAVCYLLVLPAVFKTEAEDQPVEELTNKLLKCQLQAIMEDDTVEFEDEQYDDYDISFNRRGNVNMARRIMLNGNDLIISLGTGRIYEDDE